MLDLTVAKTILEAKCPEDVFGSQLAGDKLVIVKAVYKQIVQVVHPDHNTTQSELAKDVFVRLTSLRDEAEHKVKAGTYGDKKASPPPASAIPRDPIDVTVKGRKFTVAELLHTGDVCDIYRCTYDTLFDINNFATKEEGVFKVAHNSSNNDLVENEAKVLNHLYPAKAVDEKFYRYLTKPHESFMLKGATNRRVNVLSWAKTHRPLTDVLKAYPKGIDFKDMVWIYKRTLVAIGFAHANGVVHGAVLPPHVLIDLESHGAKLVDWCYAVQGEGRVKAISPAYTDYYPKEIFEKKNVTPATDIYMAAKCAVSLLGGDVKTNQMPDTVPVQIQAFLKASLATAPSRRPTNAWDLHQSFEELLARTVGKRKFRKLELP